MYVNVPIFCCSENSILKSKDQEDEESCSWRTLHIEPTLRIHLKVVNGYVLLLYIN